MAYSGRTGGVLLDHPIPDVPVTITILVVSVAVLFSVWVPVILYRAAIRHGRSTREALTLAGVPLSPYSQSGSACQRDAHSLRPFTMVPAGHRGSSICSSRSS